MTPRTIHLRRPATLSVQEGVFVPEVAPSVAREVEQRWAALVRANPAYFDGRLYHVLGVHRNGHGGAVMHVIDCAYRYFAVQDEQFDVGARPLGIKGLVVRDGRYLMGLRTARVAFYRNMWEFAPAGSMEPGCQPGELIRRELHEETGLDCLHKPTARAIIFDPVLRTWELLMQLDATSGEPKPRPAEFDELTWRALDNLPEPLSPIARQIADFLRGG
jgi:8-oxo-dGTP pyrophosphatase MutT (NUDIX family)